MKKILFFAVVLMSAVMFTACKDSKTPEGDKTKLWPAMEDNGEVYGFINAQGKFAIKPQYKRVASFSCGWCLVVEQEGEKYEYKFIDKNNKKATGFNEDYLSDYHFYYDRLNFRKDDKYGKYDNKFNIVVDAEYSSLGSTADNGLSSFRKEFDGEAGYIDQNGKVAIKEQFYGAGAFADGIAVASIKENDKLKRGIINGKGKFLVEPQTDYGFINLGEGRVSFFKYDADEYKYGLMDKNGNVVIEPKYDYIYAFSCGLAMVEKDHKYGFINTKGQEVLAPEYEGATDFVEDMAWVLKDENAKVQLINKHGKVLLTLKEGESVESMFHNGLALLVSLEESESSYTEIHRYINKSGKTIYKWKYVHEFNWAPKHETLREMSTREMLGTEKGYLFNQEIEGIR